MERLNTANIRRSMFGRSDRSSCYIVQCWYLDGGVPAIWRSRFAYTMAGVQRIVQGEELTHGVRGPHRIQVLQVTEVDITTR